VREIIAGIAMAAALAGAAAAQDLMGGEDHPMISRYAGSTIVNYDAAGFDEYELILGPREQSGDGYDYAETRTLEGSVTRILYRPPQDRSTLELVRNYENSLQEQGFETVFSCSGDECGLQFYSWVKPVWTGNWTFQVFYAEPRDQRYLAARLERPDEGDVWAVVYASEHTLLNSLSGPYVHLDVIELEPIELDMVEVDPDALSDDITAQGHAAVYGVYFDTDSAALRAESGQALSAIATLMAERPELRVHVVGHTDAEGGFDYNLDLSRRRAASVVEALINDHGVAASRLTPNGVGWLAPVSTNRTEAGRALNRRVELVEQP